MRSLFLGLFLALSATADAPKPGVGAVGRLIDQLGHPSFAMREDASKTLLELGEPALDALRRARTSTDAEIRRRVTLLVRQIEQQVETARVLAPSRIRLMLKDTPLPDAVDELARKANVKIELKGERTELARKKLTLDTGDVPFWDAFDRLCRSACLVEPLPEPTKPKPAQRGISGSIVVIGGIGGGGRANPRDIMKPTPEEEAKPLVLMEGKPVNLPVLLGNGVRMRVLPAEAPLAGKPRGEGEHLFGLEPKAEPRMIWKGVLGVRLNRAIDDQGQQLANLTVLPKPEPDRNAGSIVINQVPINTQRQDPGFMGPIPLRLKKGEKPAKLLKELSGTLSALVQTAPEPLVTVEDVMKAAGKSLRGEKGGALRVGEVSRKDGEVKLRVQVETPATGMDDGAQLFPGATVIINGEVLGQKREGLSAANFTLLDAQGKPLTIVKATDTGLRAGTAREVELVFQAAKEQTPAKFVYHGRRTALVDVPFTLRDVPLP